MSWYVRTPEREFGPVSEEALLALVSTGQVAADSLVCRSGTTHWTTTTDSGLLPRANQDQIEAAVARPGPPSASDSLDDRSVEIFATPWPRFWARALDLILDGSLIGFTIGALRPSLLEEHGILWQFLLELPCCLLVDCLLYGVFGSTPGKAVAGIRVVSDPGGERLGFAAYFKRNVEVYLFGFGLGLPLISLATLFWCYRKLADGETLSWDLYAESKVIARSASRVRTWLVAVIYLGLLVGLSLIERSARIEEAMKHLRVRRAEERIRAEQSLQATARAINERGPWFVRPDNRFDSARAGPGLTFTYEYTMIAVRRSRLSSQDLERLRQGEQDRLFRATCRGSLIHMIQTAEVIRAHYSDRDGADLATAEVKRADCGWRQ